MTLAARRLLALGGLALLFALAVGGLGGVLYASYVRAKFDFLYGDFTLAGCLAERVAAPAQPAPPDLAFCWEKLRLQGLLNDFLIRRINFEQQHLADQVILWMVLVLTLSGVILAAFQIVASTRLGEAAGAEPASSELTIERDKLFLRSSITGLFILIVSFAFFFTYILYVYTITETGGADRLAPAAQAAAPAPAPVSPAVQPPGVPRLQGGGGLGTPR